MKKIFFITSLFVGSIYASNGGLENLIEKLEEHKRSFEESRDKNARLIVKGAKKLKKATCDFEKGFITEADFRKIESETLPVLDMCMRFYNEDDAKVKSYVADIAEQKARLRSKQSEQSFQKKIEIYLRNTLSEDCEGGENVRECVIECIKLTCYNMKISYDKIMKLMNCFKDMCAKYTGETQYYISDTFLKFSKHAASIDDLREKVDLELHVKEVMDKFHKDGYQGVDCYMIKSLFGKLNKLGPTSIEEVIGFFKHIIQKYPQLKHRTVSIIINDFKFSEDVNKETVLEEIEKYVEKELSFPAFFADVLDEEGITSVENIYECAWRMKDVCKSFKSEDDISLKRQIISFFIEMLQKYTTIDSLIIAATLMRTALDNPGITFDAFCEKARDELALKYN